MSDSTSFFARIHRRLARDREAGRMLSHDTHMEAEEARLAGKGSEDPMYEDSRKNK